MASVVGLIGFMGSGKTAAGRRAAGAQEWDFLDLDEEIVRRTGVGVVELFATRGEDGFRREETAALAGVLSARRESAMGRPLLLSLGGGILTREENLALLRDVPLLYLEVDTATAWRRVRGSERPLARSRDTFEELAAARRPVYERWATLTVPTAGRAIAAVADDVATYLATFPPHDAGAAPAAKESAP